MTSVRMRRGGDTERPRRRPRPARGGPGRLEPRASSRLRLPGRNPRSQGPARSLLRGQTGLAASWAPLHGTHPKKARWVSIKKSLIQFTTCIEVGRKSGFSPQALQKPLRELTPGTSTSGKMGWGHFSLLLPLGTAKTPEYKLSNIQGLPWWSSG